MGTTVSETVGSLLDRLNIDRSDHDKAIRRALLELLNHREAPPRPRTFDERCANALADEVDVLVHRKVIDSRSPAADALLDYRNPPSTPRSDRLAKLEAELGHERKMTSEAVSKLTALREERDSALGALRISREATEVQHQAKMAQAERAEKAEAEVARLKRELGRREHTCEFCEDVEFPEKGEPTFWVCGSCYGKKASTAETPR